MAIGVSAAWRRSGGIGARTCRQSGIPVNRGHSAEGFVADEIQPQLARLFARLQISILISPKQPSPTNGITWQCAPDFAARARFFPAWQAYQCVKRRVRPK